MNIRLFNKYYWIRRFGEQRSVMGYVVSDFSDFAASLNIHPMSADKIQGLPEGERKIKHLEGHGEVKLNVGNEKTHTKGDLLFYHDDWYECTSCQLWDHTVLSHYNYQFILVPMDASGSVDLEPPDGAPVPVKPEEGGSK